MDLVAGLSGLKTASDLTTRLREALKNREVKLDEVVARIIEIQDLISDGRTALIDAQEDIIKRTAEIGKLNEELKRLTASLDLSERVIFHDHANWKRLDGDVEEGPFCPSCWADRKLRRPQINDVHSGIVHFVCTEHKTPYHFSVPERLVKIGDLASYKQGSASFYSEPRGGGPDDWMR